MIPEHMHKLRDMAEQYNVGIPALMDTYTTKQTQYLRRDLDDPVKRHQVHDLINAKQYGNKAIEVMDRYLRMKQ